jgi:iron(III) transport system permease protein
LIGIPAGVEVLTTKIYLQIKGGLIPKYGEASAYSIILIVLVALGLIPYYRITSKTYKFTTISGKNFRPNRIALGKWRWLGGFLMLFLPLLQLFPIAAIAWSSFLPFAQIPSWKALSMLTLNNYLTAFNDSGVIRSVLNSMTVSVSSATVAVVITFFAAWLIVRASFKGAGYSIKCRCCRWCFRHRHGHCHFENVSGFAHSGIWNDLDLGAGVPLPAIYPMASASATRRC